VATTFPLRPSRPARQRHPGLQLTLPPLSMRNAASFRGRQRIAHHAVPSPPAMAYHQIDGIKKNCSHLAKKRESC
jgi:hypothetical protein